MTPDELAAWVIAGAASLLLWFSIIKWVLWKNRAEDFEETARERRCKIGGLESDLRMEKMGREHDKERAEQYFGECIFFWGREIDCCDNDQQRQGWNSAKGWSESNERRKREDRLYEFVENQMKQKGENDE